MARSLEKRLKSDLNAIRYCLRTSDFWLMRPGPLTRGSRPEMASTRPRDALRASLLPLSSPRGVERNNKDTTKGARTLTAATYGWAWEKLRLSGLNCPSSGGCFPASRQTMLYSMRGKLSTTFLIARVRRAGEDSGRGLSAAVGGRAAPFSRVNGTARPPSDLSVLQGHRPCLVA